MPLRRSQLAATGLVLPRIVTVTPLAGAAVVAALVVGVVSSPANVVLHLRLAGMFVAAATAGILDDAAAATLAPSPTPLLVRRAFRVASGGAAVAGWWMLMLAIATASSTSLPVAALTREVAVLTAIALVAACVVQARSGDGGGSAGGIVAVGWFALSFLPPLGRVPLPPDALDPGAGKPLTLVALVAIAGAIALSLDPARRRMLRVR